MAAFLEVEFYHCPAYVYELQMCEEAVAWGWTCIDTVVVVLWSVMGKSGKQTRIKFGKSSL
jgi:hypothetical protein